MAVPLLGFLSVPLVTDFSSLFTQYSDSLLVYFRDLVTLDAWRFPDVQWLPRSPSALSSLDLLHQVVRYARTCMFTSPRAYMSLHAAYADVHTLALTHPYCISKARLPRLPGGYWTVYMVVLIR